LELQEIETKSDLIEVLNEKFYSETINGESLATNYVESELLPTEVGLLEYNIEHHSDEVENGSFKDLFYKTLYLITDYRESDLDYISNQINDLNNKISANLNLSYDNNIDYANNTIDGTITHTEPFVELDNNSLFLSQKENIEYGLLSEKEDLIYNLHQFFPLVLSSFIRSGKSFKFQLAFTYNENSKLLDQIITTHLFNEIKNQVPQNDKLSRIVKFGPDLIEDGKLIGYPIVSPVFECIPNKLFLTQDLDNESLFSVRKLNENNLTTVDKELLTPYTKFIFNNKYTNVSNYLN
jgi:hypothetical protein